MKNAGLAIGMFMTWLIMTGFIGLGINALFDGIIPLFIMWIFVVSTGVLWLFVFCILAYEDKK